MHRQLVVGPPGVQRLVRRPIEFAPEQIHHLAAAIVQPAQLARRVTRVCVGRDQRQRDRRVEIAHHRVGQPVRIDPRSQEAS